MKSPALFAAAWVAAPLATLCASPPALAADEAALQQLRAEVRQMRQDYETRIQALEQRLREAEPRAPTASATTAAAASPAVGDASGWNAAAAPGGSAPASTAAPSSVVAAAPATRGFNPEVSLILGGSYQRLSRNPDQYRLQGFMPGDGEVGPGSRSFNLGESELGLAASVDPYFSGRATLAFDADNQVNVEEAYARTSALPAGLTLQGGRFYSALGYLNSQHKHTWDFADAPLAYQAFLGGQFKQDGAQLRWLAPTDRYTEIALEAGRGNSFPGTGPSGNGLGAWALTAHVGDDLGDSASWRLGASYLHTRARDRAYTELDGVQNSFSGRSRLWAVDGVLKWAPGGNATRTSFKLQGEYFHRLESGELTYDSASAALPLAYRSAQSGWYVQGVYQFLPAWRVGLRYDRLNSGTPRIGSNAGVGPASFAALGRYNPSRSTVMLDYAPTEFSRLRLQVALDRSRPGGNDRQWFLQYIMSLGAHGAHSF